MVKRYKQNEIDELADILRNDGIISVPTDTVYGLCAILNSVKAYDKLKAIKKRPMNKSFPIMCANEEQIKSIAIVNSKAEKIIRTFMPGPITLVLKKKSIIQDYASNGKDTIAVRMATSITLKNLIERVGCPIFMTSANQSRQPTCNNLDEIEKVFPNLDGMMEGIVKYGEASTIVDCSSEEIHILRIGPISIEQINEMLGDQSMVISKEYIDFPIEEHESLLKRIKNNQIIYTTRVSNKVNKYFINFVYDSPFGKLKVIYIEHFTNIEEHPFLNELNEIQIAEINKYINENGFDLIGLISV